MTLRRPRFGPLFRAAALAAGLLSAAPAAAQLLVSKAFTPANVAPAEVSTLTIQVLNNTTTTATAVAITDQLPTSPTGLRIGTAGLLSNSCGGTVTATAGATKVTLTGGTVAAAAGGNAGSCAITVQVVATPGASTSSTTYVNTIPTANVSSSIGGTSSAVSATLSVAPVLALTGTMAFSPTVIKGDGSEARLRITLNNPNSYAVTAVAFTNTLATSLATATTPDYLTTCTGGTVGGTTTTVTLTGATIAAGGSCYVEIDLIARTPTAVQNGSVTNSIAANGVTTDQKTTSSAISGSVTVQTGAAVTKAFAAATVSTGQNSTLTITITNYRAIALGPFTLTDTLPTGLVTTGTGTTTCSGGTVATSSGGVTLSSATLPAAPAAASGGTTCTITVLVAASSNGSYVNTIPAGTLASSSFNAATATLLVTAVRGIKSFSPSTVPRTGASTLTITLYNRNTSAAAAISSFADDLTTMGSDITIGGGTASTTCGGTLTAATGGTSVSLSGGSIPIAASSTSEGSCRITVPLLIGRLATISTRTNTVAAGALKTSNGNSTVAFTATLRVVAPLTATAAFSPATVVTGTPTTLTITLTRAAYAAFFTNLAFTDTLPTGFTVAPTPAATTDCSGGTVTATPGASSFSLAGGATGTTLSAASSCTVSLKVTASNTVGSYTNTLAIGAITADTAQGSVATVSAVSATATTITSVTLNTSFSPTSTTPGGTSRLSVFIANPASIGALSGVVVTDNLPTGLVVKSPANATFVANSGTCTGTIDAVAGATRVRITGAAISAGAQCQLSFDVTTNAIGTLVNTLPAGALTSNEGYTNANSASATLISSGSAEVSITKTDGVASMVAGGTTTYTLVVTNNSSAIAVSGLPVTDADQSGLTIVSWTCTATSGSICEVTSGTGALAAEVDLAAAGQATFKVVARLAADYAAAQVTNTARINPAGAGISDSNPANDAASDTNDVTRSADVAVAKTASSASPRFGDTITFTITASNAGPSLAEDVVVTDALPSGYTLVSATPSDGDWASPTWTVGDLAANDSAVLTVTATVNRTGNRTNTATIAGGTPDPVSTNNTASVTPGVVGLTIRKLSAPLSDPTNGTTAPKAIPGAVIQYSIVLSNETSTAIDANTIVITDVLPTQVTACVASPAVTMTDGSPSSGLTFTPASDVTWSRQSGGGAPFTYTPVADASGCDALVTGIRIAPRGQIAAGTTAAPTGATFTFKAKIK